MRSPLRSLRFAALVVAVTILGAGCGTQEAALRSEGQARSTTTSPLSSTSPQPSGGSLPALTTTTSRRPVVTTASANVFGGSDSGVNGTVLFGPVCPVERVPPDPQCAPRPGVADIQLMRLEGSVAAQGRAGTDGQFTVAVGPGRYTVKASVPTPGPGRGCQVEPAQVTVPSGSFTSVAVTCDTGIR